MGNVYYPMPQIASVSSIYSAYCDRPTLRLYYNKVPVLSPLFLFFQLHIDFQNIFLFFLGVANVVFVATKLFTLQKTRRHFSFIKYIIFVQS